MGLSFPFQAEKPNNVKHFVDNAYYYSKYKFIKSEISEKLSQSRLWGKMFDLLLRAKR